MIAKHLHARKCCNPTLRECEDETHTPKIGTWESYGTPEALEFDCRGQNTLHLGCSLYHWKAIKMYMSKMASHGPFGHLQHKLWQKEGSRVKLVV
jgi:hypothetical protein